MRAWTAVLRKHTAAMLKKKPQNKIENTEKDLNITLLRESFKFLRVHFHGIRETITLFCDSKKLRIMKFRESFKFLHVHFHVIRETITLFRDSARLRITKSRESFTFLRGHFHVITGNYHVISCLWKAQSSVITWSTFWRKKKSRYFAVTNRIQTKWDKQSHWHVRRWAPEKISSEFLE